MGKITVKLFIYLKWSSFIKSDHIGSVVNIKRRQQFFHFKGKRDVSRVVLQEKFKFVQIIAMGISNIMTISYIPIPSKLANNLSKQRNWHNVLLQKRETC